ncbi:MAG: HD domain-containing protein [Actinomycetota bacterium]|nr:HD domain-containing protein [Actinomycetota bacterium]
MNTDGQLQDRVRELEAELAARRQDGAENERQLERYAADLRETFKEERTRAQELRRSYMLTVRALASAVEARDAYTGRHAERVAAYGLRLAAACGMPLGDHPEIEFGFLLHDAGKVAVPDAILFKPGPLTNAERLIMQQHPVTGWEIVRDIDFLGAARDVIRHHHERWDGTGYPDGLSGEEIPISARIFAVADTLDALTTNRPYRQASTIAQARVIILQGNGTHFDPDVIEVFKSLPDEVLERIRLDIG